MFLLVKGTNQYRLNQSSASSPGSRFKCLHLQRSQHMQGVSGCAPQLCVVLQRGWVPFFPPTSLHLAFCQPDWYTVVQISSSASYNLVWKNTLSGLCGEATSSL